MGASFTGTLTEMRFLRHEMGWCILDSDSTINVGDGMGNLSLYGPRWEF
jgi:hypothetical protein